MTTPTKQLQQCAFNKAYAGMAGQGFRQCYDMYGNFTYINDGGERDPIGYLVQKRTAEGLYLRDVFSVRTLARYGIEFVSDLMAVHDNATDAADMKARFRRLAKNRHLKVPKL
jgi:hypothetical protein